MTTAAGVNTEFERGSGKSMSNAVKFIGGVLLGIILGAIAVSVGHTRDLGQWENSDPELKAWYQNLKQPDNPTISCCGEADAYWADSYEMTPTGEYIAIITDERTNVPNRPYIAPGTKIVIPKHKLKFDQGNPTGHGIVFLTTGLHVYCFLAPGGV